MNTKATPGIKKKTTHIAFRVDSSSIMGYGHVMRCLTLAQALLEQFGKQAGQLQGDSLLISFICREHQGHINRLIKEAGFNLISLGTLNNLTASTILQTDTDTWLGVNHEKDASDCVVKINTLPFINLLIVDHYAIDYKWQTLISSYCQALMVIDDLANRRHHCDILLDQTYGRNKDCYLKLSPQYCQLLIGEQYMLLRGEFSILRKNSQRKRALYIQELKNKQVKDIVSTNILVSMGGSDPDNLTQTSLNGIKNFLETNSNLDVTSTVIISSQSKHRSSIKKFCKEHDWATLIVDCQEMAELMLLADLAIGASGTSAWERCCLGLPCLSTVNAENQQLIANNLEQAGAIINLGWFESICQADISSAITSVLCNVKAYEAMATACFNIGNGRGAIKVAEHIINTLINQELRNKDEK